MTGSMYASIAGLKAHMQKLSVIGNNVANVNTAGYKTQRTVFRDSMYRYYKSGSNGTETIGGMNPSQLGYGSLIGSIDIDMSSSSYNPGNSMDCALVGDGFFLVGNKEVAKSLDPKQPDTLKSLTLTRVGDFYFGPDGYLVDGGGNCVYGFMNVNDTGGTVVKSGNGYKMEDGKQIPNISNQLVPIRLPRWEKVPEYDTSNPPKEIGTKYEIRYAATKSLSGQGGENQGVEVELFDQEWPAAHYGNNAGTTNANEEKLAFAQFSSISIDAGTGAITGICREGDQVVTIGYLAVGSVTNPNGVSHTSESYYRCDAGAGDMMVTMLGGVNKDLNIDYFNKYMLEPATTNGALPDPNATTNYPHNSEVVSSGNTKMMTGFLEAPNVDLATEISELITTQRGYQANTRIITVTDSMLEELVNMKR